MHNQFAADGKPALQGGSGSFVIAMSGSDEAIQRLASWITPPGCLGLAQVWQSEPLPGNHSPGVECGVEGGFGESVSEQRNGVGLGEELAAIGERLALGAQRAAPEEHPACAAVGERGGGVNHEGELTGKAGIGSAGRELLAGVAAKRDRQDGIRLGGRRGEGDPAVAEKGLAQARADERGGLRDVGAVLHRRDIDRGEGRRGTSAQAVVRAAGKDEREQGQEDDFNHGFHG